MAQKKVIIVGATSGIGKALACMYAQKGDMVAITGRREHLLNEIKAMYPDQVTTSCFDVRDDDNQEKIRQLIKEMQGLDLLIYNAGYGEQSSELSWDIDRQITDTNVCGCVSIVNYAFRYFMQQGSGQLALTSSVAALRGNSKAPAYSASKAFMSTYAEGLSIKAGRSAAKIVVTDIKPGFVDTKTDGRTKRFWVSGTEKAARQIMSAIEHKKRVAYITKRWFIVGLIMKFMPYSIYKQFV